MSNLLQNILHLKSHGNFEVVGCTKFATHQVTQVVQCPNFLFTGFQGYFCKITLAPFHLSLQIRKIHGNAGL